MASKQQQEHTSDFQQKEGGRGDQDAKSLGLGEKCWRALMEVSMARSRKIRGSNYVQLATVDTQTNEPRCRTVVFRGFQKFPDDHLLAKPNTLNGMSTVMKICTNAQSKKVSESTSAELVWWFPKSNEQYRVRGELLYVGGGSFPKDDDAFLQQARRELWGNLSDPARESFLSSTVPGEPVSNQQKQQQTTTNDIPAGGRDPETGKPVPVPDTFLLVLLFPRQSDCLNLSHNYRQIDKIVEDAEGKWSFETVHA